MNTKKTVLAALVLAASFAMSEAAHAALLGRDLNGSAGSFEAYYDTDLDITWLADANYAQTSGYDADGKMTWYEANAWAANLNFSDGVKTYNNWRLPSVTPINGSTINDNTSYNGSTDRGYNISEQGTVFAGSTGSEMAHLFYNTLNNKGHVSPLSVYPSYTIQEGWGLTNTGPFSNFQAYNYWSAMEYAPSTGNAWDFDFYLGYQSAPGKYNGLYALAVSPGDVAAIPEADTWAMLLVGLGLIGIAVRPRPSPEVPATET